MSDLPSLPAPDPAGGSGDAVDDLWARFHRTVRSAKVSVPIVLATGGIVGVAADHVWTRAGSLVVTLGCTAIVVVLAHRADSVNRSLGYIRGPLDTADRPVPAPVEAVRAADSDDPDQRREVFVKLARRLQSLVNRAIGQIDTLERDIEDPEILRGLFGVDHLVTRVRRQAENIAVLGGEAPQRRSVKPVSVYAVLRSAVAEIEHYKQISIIGVEGAHLHGHVVAEIIHLLAELLENATTFSAPDSGKVVLRAQKVTAGLAIEVQDRGLGMNPEDLEQINHLLDGSTTIDITELLGDGRIGLAVVKQLAGRHHVRVRLQTNVFGGIDAAIVLPHQLLVDPQAENPAPAPGLAPKVSPVPRNAPGSEVHPPLAATPVGNDLPHSTTPLPTREPRQPGPAGPPSPTAVPAPAPAPARAALHGGGPEQSAPPPLPQRHGSHLSPQLREPASPTLPLPGHTTNLMAAVQQGRGRERTDDDTPTPPGQPHQNTTTQGES